MKWTIKLVFEAIPGSPVEHEVGMIERAEEISPASASFPRFEGKNFRAAEEKRDSGAVEYIPRHL
jgi:hypothetical protein